MTLTSPPAGTEPAPPLATRIKSALRKVATRVPENDISMVLFGCRPLVPHHGWDHDTHFHAPYDVRTKPRPPRYESDGELTTIERQAGKDNRPYFDPAEPPTAAECPTCRGKIGLAHWRLEGVIVDEYEPPHPDLLKASDRDHPDLIGHYTVCGRCHSMSPQNERRAEAGRRDEEVRRLSRACADDAAARARREMDAIANAGHVFSESDRRRLWFGVPGDGLTLPAEMILRTKAAREFLARIGQLPNPRLVLNGRGQVVGEIEGEIELTDDSLHAATRGKDGQPIDPVRAPWLSDLE